MSEIVGFGFSPIVNDYKIVISREKELDQEDNRVEVYSLSTGLWREVKVEDFGGVRLHSHPVTANGSIFWPGDDSEDDWMIIAFDITMEVFSLLPPPASLYFGSRPCLTAYENKLATVIENHEICAIDFWLMDECTSASGQRCSWSKKYTISTCLSWYPRCIWMDQIVCDVTDLYKSESDESECEANNGRHTVLSLLNLRTHVLEKNFIHRFFIHRYRVSGIFKYAESLVSVGMIFKIHCIAESIVNGNWQTSDNVGGIQLTR
ncbi:F-box/kelch-repeat protein At3g23880-like [Prosopis cineraria]|uniref:F-box/kelch-repeat protein At3g23880-like n=1 Tax=Prosopis cineraria TaxID=364024 RepID=UPI0024109C2B|nr:F-box/kelch-repeat protein At3g23880-like [Prosopis cineraria]